MIIRLANKQGQSTLEYAVLIVIIIAALLSINTYVKRGVQGRMKSSADDIGKQYSEGNTRAIQITETNVTTRDTFGLGDDGTTSKQGKSISKIVGEEKTLVTEKSQILDETFEYWGAEQPPVAQPAGSTPTSP